MLSVRRLSSLLQDRATFFILFLLFLLHLPYLFNGFTWLDHRDIEQGAGIMPLHLLFPHAFLLPYADTYFYRPIITILHSLDYAIYHSFSPGYHLTNLLLFIAIIAAASFFLRSFIPVSKKQSLILMLLIGIHPLTWLPVGSISYRPELAMTLCVFLGFGCYTRARMTTQNEEKRRLISLTVLFSLLALLSKETSLYLLPILILYWEVLKAKNFTIKTILPVIFPIFGVFVLYSILRIAAIPRLWETGTSSLSMDQWLGTRIYTFAKLLIHLLLPILPRIDDSVPIVSMTNPTVLLSLLGFFLLIILLRKYSLHSPLIICLSLIALSLLPGLNIIHLPRFYSPHYAFFAVIPFVMAVILLTKRIPRKLQYLFLFLWAGIAMTQTVFGANRFYSDYTLFSPEVKAKPLYKEGNLYLGNYYAQQGQYTLSERSYKASLAMTPGFINYSQPLPALLNLTTVLLKERKYPEASKYLAQLETLSPATYKGEIRNRKAYLASASNKPLTTIALLEPSVNELGIDELTLLATAYHDTHQDKKAIETLKKTLPLLSPEKRIQLEQFISQQTK